MVAGIPWTGSLCVLIPRLHLCIRVNLLKRLFPRLWKSVSECYVGGSYGRRLEERAAVQRSCRVGKNREKGWNRMREWAWKKLYSEGNKGRTKKRSAECRPFKSCWATASSVAVGDWTFLSFVCLLTRGGFDYDFLVSRDSCRVIETGLVENIWNPIDPSNKLLRRSSLKKSRQQHNVYKERNGQDWSDGSGI
jgi:hypothetical protein